MFSAGRGSTVSVRDRGRKISTELGLKPQNNMINVSIFDIQTLYNIVFKLTSVESAGSCLI